MSEWIHIKDRLPEKLVEVLVYKTDGTMQVSVRFDCYLGIAWENRDEINSSCAEEVTHWMPLPLRPEPV